MTTRSQSAAKAAWAHGRIYGIWVWVLDGLARAHRAWVRSRTIAALAALDDNRLEDLGIHRNEIHRFVRDLERGVDSRGSR